MPTPASVLGVSSRQSMFHALAIAFLALEVAAGTTLHRIAPSKRAAPINFFTRSLALSSPHEAVGIFACRRTPEPSAKPRCVLVLPISRSRIMQFVLIRCRYSFFQGDVSTHDAFQVAMFTAQ